MSGFISALTMFVIGEVFAYPISAAFVGHDAELLKMTVRAFSGKSINIENKNPGREKKAAGFLLPPARQAHFHLLIGRSSFFRASFKPPRL